jgi:hypothetical protein
MTKFAISSGHAKHCQGASGYPVPPQCNEVDEARRVTERTCEIINALPGHSAVYFHDNTSYDSSTNLSTITKWHNNQDRDYDVSVHFNAYDGNAHGCECLYVTQESLAGKVASAMSAAGHFTNRGAKYRGDLYVLNNTNEPCVLVETCFCDNTGDCNLYNEHFEAICCALAEALTGEKIADQPPASQPPAPEEPGEGEARVDIAGTAEGNVAVIINGTRVAGKPNTPHVVRMRIKLSGDVVLCINGEEFHNQTQPPVEESGIQDNHCGIEATVFGGWEDQENSAYPPYGYLDDTELYLSLPYSFDADLFPENPPKVRVWNGSLSAVGYIADKGPWTTDDAAYVDGEARPIAETCYEQGKSLPSGPNQGKVPTNKAGIDLSPALANMVGIDGKGVVDWEFVD